MAPYSFSSPSSVFDSLLSYFLIPFWAAAPKGQCPLEHSGKIPYVGPSVDPVQKPHSSPLRHDTNLIGPENSFVGLDISPLRPDISPM